MRLMTLNKVKVDLGGTVILTVAEASGLHESNMQSLFREPCLLCTYDEDSL